MQTGYNSENFIITFSVLAANDNSMMLTFYFSSDSRPLPQCVCIKPETETVLFQVSFQNTSKGKIILKLTLIYTLSYLLRYTMRERFPKQKLLTVFTCTFYYRIRLFWETKN